jgi:hypothetical protein
MKGVFPRWKRDAWGGLSSPPLVRLVMAGWKACPTRLGHFSKHQCGIGLR